MAGGVAVWSIRSHERQVLSVVCLCQWKHQQIFLLRFFDFVAIFSSVEVAGDKVGAPCCNLNFACDLRRTDWLSNGIALDNLTKMLNDPSSIKVPLSTPHKHKAICHLIRVYKTREWNCMRKNGRWIEHASLNQLYCQLKRLHTRRMGAYVRDITYHILVSDAHLALRLVWW